MKIKDLFEDEPPKETGPSTEPKKPSIPKKIVAMYPGRFQMFHKGHGLVYKWLKKKYGNVKIVASDKVEPPRSPFNFQEKLAMMKLAGVNPSDVVQVRSPYQPVEATQGLDENNTILLFAISEKDMAEDPRFAFKPKKDGSPGYLQPLGSDPRPMSEHGYVVTVPTFDFTVLGEPMRSATELRANFARADQATQKRMIQDLYGAYDPAIHKLMAEKLR